MPVREALEAGGGVMTGFVAWLMFVLAIMADLNDRYTHSLVFLCLGVSLIATNRIARALEKGRS